MTAIVWDFAGIKAALNRLTGKTPGGRGGVLKIEQPPQRALPPIQRIERRPVNLFDYDWLGYEVFPNVEPMPLRSLLKREQIIDAVRIGTALGQRKSRRPIPPEHQNLEQRFGGLPRAMTPDEMIAREREKLPVCAVCEDRGCVMSPGQPLQFEECPNCFNPDNNPSP